MTINAEKYIKAIAMGMSIKELADNGGDVARPVKP